MDFLAKSGRFCFDKKGKRLSKKEQKQAFENDMKKTSNKILGYINDFTWTIAADSRDYMPDSPLGCCNASGIGEKNRGKRGQHCEHNRDHGLGKKRFAGRLELGA